MKKKGKKGKHKDSFEDQSDAGNADSIGKRSGGSKTRLRRRRGESHVRSDTDSDGSEHDTRKKKKRRRKKKTSRATTASSDESSDWDGSYLKRGSKVTTEDEKSKEKPKQITEHDLVMRLQLMVPYIQPNNSQWTKYTLAPLYYFIRNPDANIVVAFMVHLDEINNKTEKASTSLHRLIKFFQPVPSNDKKILITFSKPIPEYVGEFFYFVKCAPVKINAENFEEVISFGNAQYGHVETLNSLVNHLWTPILFGEEFIPDGVKNEVFADLNTLSCSSQSASYLLNTKQVLLYAPNEAFIVEKNPKQLSKDKEFCSRLEETVTYWISKINQVLILKELDDTDGWPGPLDEINFWQSRNNNLAQILMQIRSPQAKRILSILVLSRSPYIDQLRSLTSEIDRAHVEAASNYHYLQCLLQPCTTFPTAKLSEIRDQMQKFLWLVLIIKRNAPFYNTSNRVNSLMRKFSNVLIIMCKNRVKLTSLFQGIWILSSEKMIKKCLRCLGWWKEIYFTTEKAYKDKEGEASWIFEYDQIFIHVDALISRMNNLLEICIAQKLYRRRVDDSGEVSPLPLYPGIRGPYIFTTMQNIVDTMATAMKKLATVSNLVLNVKSTAWIEHMTEFQAVVLSIEMRIQNLMEEEFGKLVNLKQRLEFLHLFYQFYSRDIIIRQIDKLAIKVYEYFEEEMLMLRKLFEQKLVPLPKTFSQEAGKGTWATYMKRRIEHHLETLKNAESWLPKSGFGDQVKENAKGLVDAIASFAQKTYDEWSNSKDFTEGKDLKAKLDIPLLTRAGRDKKDIVEINFDRNLFKVLTEAEIWAKIGKPVPFVLLMSVYTHREMLHSTRENISLVAKCYNEIMSGLSRDERLLFKERLLPLEKKIYPCLSTYKWSSPFVADHVFVEEFQYLAAEIMEGIILYREANAKVTEIIQKVSGRLMMKIIPKKIYDPSQFHAEQNNLIKKQLKRIVKNYQDVATILRDLFKVFHSDGPEVKVQWGKYVKLVDDCVEEALCISLQKSLLILEKCICSGERPLFLLEMKLEDNKIAFNPSLEKLTDMIFGVKRNIASALEPLSRISRYLGSYSSSVSTNEKSFTRALLNDQIASEMEKRMRFSIERCFSELSLYSERWIPYRDIWELNKDDFLEYYAQNHPSLEAIEKDMSKYLEVYKVVHGSEDFVNVKFIKVVCSQIKNGISERTMEWFQLLAGNLHTKTKSMLEDVYKYMEESKRKFTNEPKTLDEQLELHKMLQNSENNSRQKSTLFPVIEAQFDILNKYEFTIEPIVHKLASNLRKEWKSYQKFLKETERKLEKSYDKLRNAFQECFDNLKNRIEDLLKEFDKTGPFSTESSRVEENDVTGQELSSSNKALTSLENFLNDVSCLKQEDLKLMSSLKFFNISVNKSQNLDNFEEEIKNLIMVWEHVQQWDIYWTKWKSVPIVQLQLEDMDKVISQHKLKFQQLQKDFEAKSWPVIAETSDLICSVKSSLRTVNFLKNETLRSRHWNKIQSLLTDSGIESSLLQESSTSQYLNLGMIVSLKLHFYFDDLVDINISSGKEMAIETTLQKIKGFWSQENFILKQRKGIVPFELECRSALMDELIDHVVSLSAMKGSPFVWPFQEEVEHWGTLLSNTNENLKELLEAQNEWKFMEKIFSNEDVQKDVPCQAKQFKILSSLWASILLPIVKNKNVLETMSKNEHLQEMLENLKLQLNQLRMDLKPLLQEKRQEFPRLYFISDEELLECIGTSKEPQKLLQILRKMFCWISKLNISFKKPNIVELYGVEWKNGESITLPQIVDTSDPLTTWLADLDSSLKMGVKLNIHNCYENLQNMINRKDEWLLDNTWLIQSCLTATHLEWTADVTKAIYESSDKSEFTLKRVYKRLKKNATTFLNLLNGQPNIKSLALNQLPLTNLQRLKIEKVVIKLLYLQSITQDLHSKNCADLESFEWLQHIRYYMENRINTGRGLESVIVMKQGLASIEYGYEYVEHELNFVMTPAIDRCLLAMTTALSFHFGSFIQGNPGVGKKETVIQLGRLLGKYVLNVNLSNQTNFSFLNNLILGLVQTGSWVILNNVGECQPHIIPFLSSKLALITKVKSENMQRLMLDGIEVNMDKGGAMFFLSRDIQKQENCLFEHLRAVTRPVTLLCPDFISILDVHFHVGGFDDSNNFAKKLDKLLSSARQTLIYQNRCKFSLAAAIAVVKQSIIYKSAFKKRLNESEAIVKALQNIIMPTMDGDEYDFVADLVNQLFPSSIPSKMENAQLEESILRSFDELGYQKSDVLLKQCIRLHELMQIYKIVILVGESGTGKTAVRKILQSAISDLLDVRINEFIINPGTFESYELFGVNDSKSGNWKVGVLTRIVKNDGYSQIKEAQSSKNCHEDMLEEKATFLWIVLDGPVCNSLQNGLNELVLTNSNKQQVFIIIETDDLKHASPSLVSQSGVVYMQQNPMSWKLTLNKWFKDYPNKNLNADLKKLVTNLMDKSLKFSQQCCSQLTTFPSVQSIISMFTKLLGSHFRELEALESKFLPEEKESMDLFLRQIIFFCIVWSVFGIITEEDQLKANLFLKDIDPKVFPTKGTVFDYFIRLKDQKWVKWTSLLTQPAQYHPHDERFGSVVKTSIVARCEYFISRFHQKCPTLIIGHSNCGKTTIVTETLRNEGINMLHIQMTPKMTGGSVQSLIETRLEQVSSFVESPPCGKKLSVFIDDLNVFTECSTGSSSSYCEFLRFLVENQMWYKKNTSEPMAVSRVFIMATLNLSGKGKPNKSIPARLQSKFALVYLPTIDEFQLRRIFTAKAMNKFDNFPPAVKLLADSITVATLETYNVISSKISSSPTKPLHCFNIHDISRVYEGLFRAEKAIQDTKQGILRLWLHECARVFHDRLMDADAREICMDIFNEQLLKHFEFSIDSLFTNTFLTFGTFMNSKNYYEEIKNESSLKNALLNVDEQLKNSTNHTISSYGLVLFKTAILHVTRITRVLTMSKGHLILVGPGGTGKKTLARLASALLNYYTLESNQGLANILQSDSNECKILVTTMLRKAYFTCASENKDSCLMLSDEHISEDTLDLITLATSTVEIPDLYSKKELEDLRKVLKEPERNDIGVSYAGARDDNAYLFDFMKNRIENKFHMILCINSTNPNLRKYISEYHMLLKQMTVSYFDIWTKESYLEVAVSFTSSKTEKMKIESHESILTGELFYNLHSIVEETRKNMTGAENQTFSTITPTHFLSFITQYILTKNESLAKSIERKNLLEKALQEINKVRTKIGLLTEKALSAEKKVTTCRIECENLQAIVEKQEEDTSDQATIVEQKTGQLNAEEKEFQDLADVIKEEWSGALGAFNEAVSEVQELSEEDLTHIRSYFSPPPLVSRVLDAVMIILDREQTWPEAKIQLGHPEFVRKIVDFDKGSVTMEKLNDLKQFIQNPEFTPEDVGKHSNGARILCGWIHALDKYSRTYLNKIVPKRQKLDEMENSVVDRRESLDLQTQKLQILKENLAEIRTTYDTKADLKDNLETDFLHWSELLQRAQDVLELLKDDQYKWDEEMGHIEIAMKEIPGSALLSSACLSYLGPFNADQRNDIKQKWIQHLNDHKLNANPEIYNKANPYMKYRYKNEMLFENLLMIQSTKQQNVLIIDPHDVFSNILREKFITDELISDFSKILKIHEGLGITPSELIQYNKKHLAVQNRKLIFLTNDFNPKVEPEIPAMVYIINFSLSYYDSLKVLQGKLAEMAIQGLASEMQQCLQNLATEESVLLNFQDSVPRAVISYGESILDNGEFPNSLLKWKSELADAMAKRLEKKNKLTVLELNKEPFENVAKKYLDIYISICQLSEVNQIYGLSFKFFTQVIEDAIEKFHMLSEENDESFRKSADEIVQFLSKKAYKNLFRQIMQSMFYHDRYRFCLILCINTLQASQKLKPYKLSPKEVSIIQNIIATSNFGETIFGDPIQPKNNTNSDHESTESRIGFRQLSAMQEEKLEDLQSLECFKGLMESIKENKDFAWNNFFDSVKAEDNFPNEIQESWSTLQKLIVLSILRPDRIPLQIIALVKEVLGEEFVDLLAMHKLIDLKEIFTNRAISTCNKNNQLIVPTVFIFDRNLGSQLDPYMCIHELSLTQKPVRKLYSLTVSHENRHLARKLLKESISQGHWVYFANCHLDLKWILEMKQILENTQMKSVHKRFCLWMSFEANPVPETLNILKNSMKIAVQLPLNFEASRERLLLKADNSYEGTFTSSEEGILIKKNLHGLASLHCNLSFRKGFGKSGAFQDIDFEMSSAISKAFVQKYGSTTGKFPWWALKYMIELQYSTASHSSSDDQIEQDQNFLLQHLHQFFSTWKIVD